MAGALRADAGRVRISGGNTRGLPASIRTRLGIARTFQLVRPLPHLTALENVLVAQLFGRGGGPLRPEVRDASRRLLDLVGLGAKTSVPGANLTLVERNRLEIAPALATHPRILLLDELLGGL